MKLTKQFIAAHDINRRKILYVSLFESCFGAISQIVSVNDFIRKGLSDAD